MPRASRLLAVAPQTVEARKPKVLIYGPPGVGKTWTALDFPGVYYIDTEGGADLPHYRAKLERAGGMYFGPDQGARDFDTVISQVEALATERHAYKTVVIDSISKIYGDAIGLEQERLGELDAFGASKKAPIRQMRKLVRWLIRADMNAIIIAHQRAEWGKNDKGQQEVVGHTFDGWDKLEYDLHLALRISRFGSGENAKFFAHVGKSRLTGFPSGTRFDWSYPTFAERYGKDVIEQEVVPVEMASAEQVAELRTLVVKLKLPAEVTEKWLSKAGAEDFEEMNGVQIAACIENLKGKLPA